MKRINKIFKDVQKMEIEAHELIEEEIKKILKKKNIDYWSSLFGETIRNGKEIKEPKEINDLTEKFEDTFGANFSPQIVYKKGRDF